MWNNYEAPSMTNLIQSNWTARTVKDNCLCWHVILRSAVHRLWIGTKKQYQAIFKIFNMCLRWKTQSDHSTLLICKHGKQCLACEYYTQKQITTDDVLTTAKIETGWTKANSTHMNSQYIHMNIWGMIPVQSSPEYPVCYLTIHTCLWSVCYTLRVCWHLGIQWT